MARKLPAKEEAEALAARITAYWVALGYVAEDVGAEVVAVKLAEDRVKTWHSGVVYSVRTKMVGGLPPRENNYLQPPKSLLRCPTKR